MIDFDSIWRTQDEIRTIVNAVLGALDLGRLLPAGRKNASGISHTMKNAVPSFLNCLLPLKKIPSVIYAASSCLASVPKGRASDTCRLSNFFSATKKGFISLLYLCTQKDETRLVSSVGLEYDATNVGVGSSNLSRVTNIALWCNG